MVGAWDHGVAGCSGAAGVHTIVRGEKVDWASPEGKALLDEMQALKDSNPAVTWDDVASQFGLTKSQVRNARYRYGYMGTQVEKGNVTFNDMRVPDAEDVRDFVSAMVDMQSAQQALDTKQVKASFTLRETKPVGIAFFGDWHMGADGVDYGLHEHQVETIRNEEGLYMIGMGDYKDNYITDAPKGGAAGQIIQPGMQDRVVRYYIKKLREQILALIRGCHDHWDMRSASKDFVDVLCEDANAVNLWHGGTISIGLGNQVYTGHVRHRYKFESSLNRSNAMRRMMEMFGTADFAALAHHHNPHVDFYHLQGAYRALIRSGSVKKWDEYAQQHGFGKGKAGVPVLILWPDEHRMEAHWDLRPGIEHLRAVRK